MGGNRSAETPTRHHQRPVFGHCGHRGSEPSTAAMGRSADVGAEACSNDSLLLQAIAVPDPEETPGLGCRERQLSVVKPPLAIWQVLRLVGQCGHWRSAPPTTAMRKSADIGEKVSLNDRLPIQAMAVPDPERTPTAGCVNVRYATEPAG
jgi:hypothetical protein